MVNKLTAAASISSGPNRPFLAPEKRRYGLLSEAHVSGWNSIVEITCQLRGEAGERQIAGAHHMQWGTVWGDSIVFANEAK